MVFSVAAVADRDRAGDAAADGDPAAREQQRLGAAEQHVPEQHGVHAAGLDESQRLGEYRHPPQCAVRLSRRGQHGLGATLLPGGRCGPRCHQRLEEPDCLSHRPVPVHERRPERDVGEVCDPAGRPDPGLLPGQPEIPVSLRLRHAAPAAVPRDGLRRRSTPSRSIAPISRWCWAPCFIRPRPRTPNTACSSSAWTPTRRRKSPAGSRLVTATIYLSNSAEAYYMPTFEQSEAARTNAEAFAALGIAVASVDRWVTVNTCYAAGWALGRLKFFAAADVVAAYSDGRLRPEDILLTDGVPADTPLVAGIITLSPSTPNSHTAILSQSFGMPFAYLPDADEQARVQGLVGHKVIVRATVIRVRRRSRCWMWKASLTRRSKRRCWRSRCPRRSTFCPSSLTAPSGRTRTSWCRRNPVFRRQGGELRSAAALDSHELPRGHRLLVRSVGRVSGPNAAGGRDAAGDDRRPAGALHELPAGHRFAQDQPGRHPGLVHQDGEFHHRRSNRRSPMC